MKHNQERLNHGHNFFNNTRWMHENAFRLNWNHPPSPPAFPWHGRGCAHGLSVRIVYATLEIGTETSNLGCSRRENANINFATGLRKMQWRMVKERRKEERGKGKVVVVEGDAEPVQLRHRHKRFKQVCPHRFCSPASCYIVTLHYLRRCHCSSYETPVDILACADGSLLNNVK